MDKPFAQSCVENREPILAVLRPRLAGCRRLLEIGSGTGQHAVYFAPELPKVFWQTSDQQENHAGILAWLSDSGATNIGRPITLDVLRDPWPSSGFDAVFSANTAHIMPWDAVVAMFAGVAAHLKTGSRFCLYGPFNVDNCFTSQSNAHFDAQLRAEDPEMGIRDTAMIESIAKRHHLPLENKLTMPANNFILVFKKS